MKVTETELPGVFLIDTEGNRDERGTFRRIHCEREFVEKGLVPRFPQVSLSTNARRGILRGMHFLERSAGETKMVRCVRGRVFDVVVDVREESPTRGRWTAVELSAENQRAIYVPPGFAHGFQTLEERSDLLYMMSVFYAPGLDRGYRWNDPAFGIRWPMPTPEEGAMLSERDRNHPDFPHRQ